MIKNVVILMLLCFGIWLVLNFLNYDRHDVSIHGVSDGPVILVAPAITIRNPVVDKVSFQNSLLKSVRADKLRIKHNQNNLVRLGGTFAYEKDKLFRMTIHSQFGNEIDIGSNDILFWFCSKRYQNGALFFCNHREFNKAKMKAPFDPQRIMGSFGYDEINTSYGQLVQHNQNLAVFIREKNDMQTMKLIDPIRPAIIGSYLYNSNNHVIASTEAVKFDASGRYPVSWFIRWNEEGLSMEISLLNPSFNTPINPTMWQMPSAARTVDMSTD